MIRAASSVLLSVLVLALAGCGGPAKPKLYPVSGKVTAPKPLADVGIYFIAASGQRANYGGKIAADGSYSLSDEDQRPGAQPGKYKVVLQLTGDALQNSMMAQMKGGAGGPTAPEAPFPKEYTDAATSPKEVEVKAEANTIDITIP